MANGQQQTYDLSSAAQDPSFVNAPAQDKIAFLSAHDPDFAKASPKDKADYLNHILGYDQPSQFEKDRTGGERGFGAAVKRSLPGLFAPPDASREELAGVAHLGEKANPSFNIGDLAGFDANAAREKADRGDAWGIVGQAAVPIATALGAYAAPSVARGVQRGLSAVKPQLNTAADVLTHPTEIPGRIIKAGVGLIPDQPSFPGAPLPASEEFYQNRGTDLMRRGVQEDILARRAAAAAKANAPAPPLGSPENPDFHSKLPTRMPKPAASAAPPRPDPFAGATPSNVSFPDRPLPSAGAYSPPAATVQGVTADAYSPPEGIKGSIAKPSGRLILSPEEARAESAMQGIAKTRASQHGMLYAAGMRPAGGGRVPVSTTPTETFEYPGPRSAYDPPDAQYSRTGGAEGPYSPNFAYRAHTEGDFGINPESHAHATASPEEAEAYAQHREGGENQVVSKIDIGKLQPHEYETFTGPNGKKWYRIKRQTSAEDYE